MYNRIILLGAVISLLYTELTGLSTELIVPGYFALSLHSPGRIAYTLVLSAAVCLITRFFANRIILYGRRRFAFMMLLAFFLDFLLQKTGLVPASLHVIGILVPGLLAREMDRQGYKDALISLFIVTGILSLLLLAAGYPVLGSGS